MTGALRSHPMQAGWIDRPHRSLELGDFALAGGGSIRDFRLSYVVHGELDAARSNAVLALCALGSTHHRLDFLIGPGRALDPGRYCVICVDAIGNGLTSSPSNSAAQPGLQFPRFAVADMVESQRRLVQEHFGVERLHAVVGASMGGMQALQWAVSHPRAMARVVAMTPMAKTTAWSAAVNEIGRRALMADPAWAEPGNDSAGWPAWVPLMQLVSGRTPQALEAEFSGAAALHEWLERRVAWQRATGLDAVDWVYQTWAYDAHDIGAGPVFGGDTAAALASIRAEALVLAPPLDLFNPAEAARAAADGIPGARFVPIASMQGHQSASAARPEDALHLNRTIGEFLGMAMDSGKETI